MFAGKGLQGKPSAQLASPTVSPRCKVEEPLTQLRWDVESFAQMGMGSSTTDEKAIESFASGWSGVQEKLASGKLPTDGEAVVVGQPVEEISSPQKKGQHKKSRTPKDARLDSLETSSQTSSKDGSVSTSNAAYLDNQCRELIAKSWKELKEHEERCKKGQTAEKHVEDSDNDDTASGSAQEFQKAQKSSFRFWGRGAGGGNGKDKSQESRESSKSKNDAKGFGNQFDVPQTFEEMCVLNAAMTGANVTYVKIVQQCFEKLVAPASRGDIARLELETNIMALRMHKDVQGKIVLPEFKTCMLASLRSLLPKIWSIELEHAWSTMWDLIQETLTSNMGKPLMYEKAVKKAVSNMTADEKKVFGLNAFNRLFDKQPRAEDHFNSSNARLSMLATNVLEICVDMYSEPTRMVDVVTSIGLRHIMYNVSLDFFEPFVVSIVEELMSANMDPVAVEGIEWILAQISTIMIYTINEGSNPLLTAVVANSAKQVKAALAPISKKERAAICLGSTAKILGV